MDSELTARVQSIGKAIKESFPLRTCSQIHQNSRKIFKGRYLQTNNVIKWGEFMKEARYVGSGYMLLQ